MSRVIADGLSKRATATTQEAENAIEGKFPDAAAVHAAFNQFGLGSKMTPLPTGYNINNLNETGFFYLFSNGVNKPSASGGYIINSVYTENYKSQIFINAASELSMFARSQYNGVFSEWREVYHNGNLIAATESVAGLMSSTDKTKLNAVGTNANRNLTISTAEPSGGSDGDVWFVYEL